MSSCQSESSRSFVLSNTPNLNDLIPHPGIIGIAVLNLHPLLHFLRLLRGSAIGSTPAFGAGYPGSSPGPGANFLIGGLKVEPAPVSDGLHAESVSVL